jgi:hypothetical protein
MRDLSRLRHNNNGGLESGSINLRLVQPARSQLSARVSTMPTQKTKGFCIRSRQYPPTLVFRLGLWHPSFRHSSTPEELH